MTGVVDTWQMSGLSKVKTRPRPVSLKLWKDVLGPIVQFVATVYFGPLAGALVGATIDGWKGAAIGFAGGIGLGVAGKVGYGFASGFSSSLLNGGSIGDAFKAGVIGGAQAYVAGRIGDKFGDIGGFWNEVGRATAHGVLGGAVEEARGGEFRHGFYAGFIGSAAGSIAGTYIQGNEHWKFAARTTIAAVAGGTASVLGGGKFANGALTAAFQHMFNHESGYWSEVLETFQGYSYGAISEATYDPYSDDSSGSSSMDAGMAAGRWTVRALSAPKSLFKGLFKGGLKMAVKSGGDDALEAAAKLAVNNADNAALAAAKSARKMSTSELDRLLGKGWHQSNEKAKFFRDLKPQLDKLGIRNPDLYLSRQGEIILRDVRDAAKYLNTGIKL